MYVISIYFAPAKRCVAAPSQGIRVSNPLGDAKAADIFKSHGSGKVDLAASSVVAVGRDKMVVGSVFGDGVLVCPLPH